jgi:oligopeptide/dipeptide ABC transporter ATP-binding protein
LLHSVPRLTEEGLKLRRLATIEGTVPSLFNLPPGCKFAPRCSYVIDECRQSEPALVAVKAEHASRCIRFDRVGEENKPQMNTDEVRSQ